MRHTAVHETNHARWSNITITAVLQAAMNLVLILLFTLLAIASYDRFVHSGSVRTFGVLAVNILFLTLFLARRKASSETASPALWLLAFAGTALPLLMRPTGGSPPLAFGSVVQIIGLASLAIALLSLRRSFAVVPANRGIRDGGLYRFVRHPVYLSELTVLFGVALANPTLLNSILWLCEFALQLARARAEERFLHTDPLYEAYCARVRYRLIPGVI